MPRPQLANPAVGHRYTLAAMGDSLTHNPTLGVPAYALWPQVLAGRLTTLRARVRARNFAKNGNTSTQMVARMPEMTAIDIPTLAIIMAGVNDPGASITGATTQANIESMVNTEMTAGTQYAVIVSTQYLNYSTGGDTLSTPYATYATLRTFQQAAATARAAAYPGRVAYCDLYAYMRNLIVNGTETQGSFSWHVADANQHLNVLGNQYVAAAVLATIQAQPGWLAALQA